MGLLTWLPSIQMGSYFHPRSLLQMLSYVAKEPGNRGLSALPEWSTAPLLPWARAHARGRHQLSSHTRPSHSYNDRAGAMGPSGSQPPAPTWALPCIHRETEGPLLSLGFLRYLGGPSCVRLQGPGRRFVFLAGGLLRGPRRFWRPTVIRRHGLAVGPGPALPSLW